MSKSKKHTETDTAAPQTGEAFDSVAAPTATGEPKQKRKLGAWAITGIAAAGLLVLTGTAGAGAAAALAVSHSIVGHEGGHEFAEAGKFGGELREHGGEFDELRQHVGEFDDEWMQSHRDGQRMEDQRMEDQRMEGQIPNPPQGEQQQMQRPPMNGQTGAS